MTWFAISGMYRAQTKLDAIVAPTVGDDLTKGFSSGSVWIDNVARIAYICTDASTGAAKWDDFGTVPTGGVIYKGVWNANTNDPALSDNGGGGVKGDYYIIGTAGTTTIDGESDWNPPDWIVNRGTQWDKVDNTQNAHDIGGSLHNASTLAEFNAKLTGGNVDFDTSIRPEQHTLHFMPSIGASIGNQLKTWPEVKAAYEAAVLAGSDKAIIVEEDATISTSFDMNFGTIYGSINNPTLTIADGVVITNAGRFATGLKIDFQGSASCITDFALAASDGSGLIVESGCEISCSGSALFGSVEEGDQLNLILDFDAIISKNNYEVFGVDPAGVGDGKINVLAQGPCEIEADTIRGGASAQVAYDIRSTGAKLSTAQANLTPDITVTRMDAASNAYYWGKHGNDANTGKSWQDAFLTLDVARAAAVTQTPSATKRFVLNCQDGGVYTEDYAGASWVDVIAPGAKLLGQVTSAENSHVEFAHIYNASGQVVAKTAGSGESSVRARSMEVTGSDDAIVHSAQSLLTIYCDGLVLEDGDAVQADSVSNGLTDLHIGFIYVTGSGTGLYANYNDTQISGFIDTIMAPSGTAIHVDAGSVRVAVNRINASVAYDVAVNSQMDLIVGSMSGTEINLGTANVTRAGDVSLLHDPGSTYKGLRDFLNVDASPMVISGGVVTDNGNGTVAVTAAQCLTKKTNSETGEAVFFEAPAVDPLSLTDDSANYIEADYNGGTPQIIAEPTSAEILDYDRACIAAVWRDGTDLDIVSVAPRQNNFAHRMSRMNFDRLGTDIDHISGMRLGDAGTLHLSLSAGVYYVGFVKQLCREFSTLTQASGAHDGGNDEAILTDSGESWTPDEWIHRLVSNITDGSAAEITDNDATTITGALSGGVEDDWDTGDSYELSDFFTAYYSDGGEGFIEVPHQRTIDNEHFDDGGSLGNLTSQQYAVHWVYIDTGTRHLASIYGSFSYTLADAQDAEPPSSIPDKVANWYTFVGKVIVKKSATIMDVISAFETLFHGSRATDHVDVLNKGVKTHAEIDTFIASILHDRYTTSGGGVTEDVTLTGITAGDEIVAQINVVGSTPRIIITAEYLSANTVRVTWDGDPSTDHQFTLIAFVV